MAPELLNGMQYDEKVDIWAAGISMYMLLTGKRNPLYVKGEGMKEMKQRIMEAEVMPYHEIKNPKA